MEIMTVEDDDLEREQQPSNDDDDDDEDDDEESIRIMDIDTTFRQLLIPLASASWDAQSPRDRKAVLQTMQQQLRHNPLARNFLAEQSIGQYGLQSNRTHVVHTYIHTLIMVLIVIIQLISRVIVYIDPCISADRFVVGAEHRNRIGYYPIGTTRSRYRISIGTCIRSGGNHRFDKDSS
jgi:hypothetical protein